MPAVTQDDVSRQDSAFAGTAALCRAADDDTLRLRHVQRIGDLRCHLLNAEVECADPPFNFYRGSKWLASWRRKR